MKVEELSHLPTARRGRWAIVQMKIDRWDVWLVKGKDPRRKTDDVRLKSFKAWREAEAYVDDFIRLGTP